ncbi:molybdenum cofactor cytidylyltransferase [Photobacterium kasasachensis]|uniref:molybdenum cofactor cytidylyltransferase n=1 Tax=Photobacterium kasasachensis TaxID=2910240 RepID=UPI003D13F73A
MVQYQQVDCVMPAAGLSSRMGCWKMMLPYRHHTILDESIENALGFCSRVILVAGHRGDELACRYKKKQGVEVVVNTHYEQGMFSSIQQGAKQVKTKHFFICHGDMPCISPDIYRRVWEKRGSYTVFPGTAERPGHPVLLPATLKAQILSAPFDGKMKRIIYSGEVKYAELTETDIYFDVDTPAAYERLCQRSQ